MSRAGGGRGIVTWSVSPSHDYVAPLDGLRAVSIVLVVLGHFGLGALFPGTFGVTVFFFISGFLITRQLLAEQNETGRIHLGAFLIRRMLRLWPALIVVVPVAAIINVLAGGTTTTSQVMAGLFYFTNYLAQVQHYNTGPGGMDNPLMVLWSIAVEQHFYLIFPFVLLTMRNRPRLVAALLAIILGITAWRYDVAGRCVALGPACTEGLGAFRTAFSTEMRLDSILYGSLMAILLGTGAAPVLLRLFNAPSTLVAAIAVVLLSLLIRDPVFRSGLRYTVQGVSLFLGVGCVLFGRPYAWARRLLGSRPTVLLGRWSYSLYLWHLVVLAGALPLLPPDLWRPAILEMRPGLLWLAVVLPLLTAASVLLAIASYHLVERPPQQLRRYLLQPAS
ncbi:MAG: Acyltransferase [Roseomonas sp.]|nr:Acyltransferase [Roseomonas sp.]